MKLLKKELIILIFLLFSQKAYLLCLFYSYRKENYFIFKVKIIFFIFVIFLAILNVIYLNKI